MQTNFEPARDSARAGALCAAGAAVPPENKTQIQSATVQKVAGEPLIYAPHYLRGGAKHPGLIVETSGLANVAPPPITYRPHLPREMNTSGLISEIQFERVIYAGQAHAQRLPTGARAGISIGDGTGAGKTSTLAGIILDNWFQNRRCTVWFSVKADLIKAVRSSNV